MVVIIGAGISGLSAAYRAAGDCIILEKEDVIGGLSTQYTPPAAPGCRFDFGGHYFHFKDKLDIKKHVESFARFREFKRKSKVYILDRYIPFPIQHHLFYLPARTRNTILKEIIGWVDPAIKPTPPLRGHQRRNAPFGRVHPNRPPSFVGASPPLEGISQQKSDATNLREFLENHFGRTLYSLFFEPFMSKYYRTELSELAADMDKGSIPVPDKKSMIEGAQGRTFADTGYNPVFYYPEQGLKAFIERYAGRPAPAARKARDMIPETSHDLHKESIFSPGNNIIKMGGNIKLNEEVIEIDIDRKRVKTKDKFYDYESLINTMPLKHLLRAIKQKDRFPSYRKLRHISTLVVNVVLKRRRKRLHWVYLPEGQFPFYRAGFYPGRDMTVSYLEKTVPGTYSTGRDSLHDEICFTLGKLGFIEDKGEILFFDAKLIPVSYILFDQDWHRTVPPTLDRLKEYGIYSTGRYGAWNYTSMSDDIKAAFNTVEELYDD